MRLFQLNTSDNGRNSRKPFQLVEMRYFLAFLLFILFTACSDEMDKPGETLECNASALEMDIIAELYEQEAIPFNSADPETNDPSLDSLINYLSTARIVGLGEATHGSAEFFKMKDKIFRSLVTKSGFKAIVFEIPWGNCLPVNDFVLNGNGSADESVNQTYYWVYDTQEVRDLVVWMRDYNTGRDSLDKIYFVGCDPQGGDFKIETELVYDYLDRFAPAIRDSVYIRYQALPSKLSDYASLPAESLERNRKNVNWVYDYLESQEESLAGVSGSYNYELALMASHVIKHREDMYRRQNFGVTRDSLMAVYTLWWQEIFGLDSQVAVWAHNFHVMDNSLSVGAPWMGAELRKAIGRDYINVAFSFTTGYLNAFVADPFGEFQSAVRIQHLSQSTCNSLNYVLGELGHDRFYMIFNTFDSDLLAFDYLFQSQPFYQMGAGFNPSYMHNYTSNLDLPELWDVLIHFDEVNASQLR